MKSNISAMARTILEDTVGDIFMDGARIDWSTWVVIDRLERVKGSVRIPKAQFLIFCKVTFDLVEPVGSL